MVMSGYDLFDLEINESIHKSWITYETERTMRRVILLQFILPEV